MQLYLVAGIVLVSIAVLVFIRHQQTVEEERKQREREDAVRIARDKAFRKQTDQRVVARAKAKAEAERREREEIEAAERDLARMNAEIEEQWSREKAEEERQEVAAYEAEKRQIIASRTRQLETQLQNGFHSWLATYHMIPPNPPYADSLIAEFMNSNYWPLPPDAGLLRSSQHPFVIRCIRSANSFPAHAIPTVK